MIENYDDFFFGEGSVSEGDFGPGFGLARVMGGAEKVTPSFFTGQLNRLLAKVGGKVVLLDGTSYPPFREFMAKLVEDEIGYVQVHLAEQSGFAGEQPRSFINCDIVLANGIIRFSSYWCVMKPLRAQEMVNSLLLPLHLKGIQRRCYIQFVGNQVDHLFSSHEPYSELDKIYKLAGTPLSKQGRSELVELLEEALSPSRSMVQ